MLVKQFCIVQIISYSVEAFNESHPIVETVGQDHELRWHTEQFASGRVVVVVVRIASWILSADFQTFALMFRHCDGFDRFVRHSAKDHSVFIRVDPESFYLVDL